jgi:beta-mannosidase
MTAPDLRSLSGPDWQLKDYIGEDWLGRRAHHADTRDTRLWRTATVPGTVHHDLWQNEEIPNPYVGRNTLLCEWVPQRTWVYRKSFHVEEALRGRQLRLRFEGVDYAARFFLNGEPLGQHTGLFEPVVVDVTDRVVYDADNLIAVVIDPAPFEEPQIGYTSRVRNFKPRMNYWWDFCPRLIHLGIWDEVVLEVTGAVRVEALHARPRLAADHSRADVDITATVWAAAPLRSTVTTTLRYNGEVVASHSAWQELQAGANTASVSLAVTDPHLWWPNGHGKPALYQAEVRVDEPSGAWDAREANVGLRTLAFAPNQPAHPGARPYTLVVNGRPLYIKGWNWVPMDVMYGVERPAKRRRLLELAQRAHVNLLRIWGGGLIEKEAFYDECDRRGLLVWQEFIQSSSGVDNVPSASPDYVAILAAFARQVIPRRRNHPSLAIWCGGNELQAEAPLDETHPALAALHRVVKELDPDRLWLPTSSTGPVFENSIKNIDADPHSLHDVHGPWEHQGLEQQYTLYNRTTSLLHSEFGVEGLTNARALAAVLPDHQEPVSLDNPYWHHLGAWWVKERRWREMLGDWSSVDELLRATQFLQAEGLRYAIEANRRRKYQNSGTLPWQFNEPYPMAACTSAVDYFAEPKPVYYAVRRAYAPLLVSARFARQAWAGKTQFEAEVFANHSGQHALANAEYTAELRDMRGQVRARLADTTVLAPNAVTRLGTLRADLAGIDGDAFVLDLSLRAKGGRGAANRYCFSRTSTIRPLLDLAPADIHVEADCVEHRWGVIVTNRGPVAALGVWLEDQRPHPATGWLYADDNYFTLLPGESRTTLVEWDNVPVGERRLQVSGWNTVTQPITCASHDIYPV